MRALKRYRNLRGIAVAGALLTAGLAYGGPQAMFGLSYTWGGSVGAGNVGLSVKVISDNKKDKVIAAAGATYYPWAPVKKFGADLSGGYLFDSFALTGGWDFLQSDWIVSAGYVNTIEENEPAATPPASGGGNDGGNDAVVTTLGKSLGGV